MLFIKKYLNYCSFAFLTKIEKEKNNSLQKVKI